MKRRETQPPRDPRTMTDAEVAALFGIHKRTLQARCHRPVPGEINPNDAEPQVIGGRRFWVRAKVERLAGITAEGNATT